MTVSEMLSELNDHGFTDESTTAKVRVLQHTIWDLEAREPWPWLETSALLNFDGTNEYASNWPADFRAALVIKDLGGGGRIRPVTIDEFEDEVGTDYTQSGTPLLYYFEGLKAKFWPIPPAQSGRMKLRYLKWSAAISDSSVEADILIPKYFHRLVVYGALWKLYDMEDDPELAQRFEQHFEQGIAVMKAALWARQFDRVDHIRMEDPDDWHLDC